MEYFIFSLHQKIDHTEEPCEHHRKDVAETRWESKVKGIELMRYQGSALREALIEVKDKTKDLFLKAEAQSLSKEVESCSFSTCMVVWCNILSAIQHVRKLTQSPNI